LRGSLLKIFAPPAVVTALGQLPQLSQLLG
jgi:hypothetical protein